MDETGRTKNPALETGERLRPAAGPSLTRRRLLAGTGKVALLAAIVSFGCTPVANKAWADGTFWDDGLGWSA